MLTLNNLVDYLEASPKDNCVNWISIGSASNVGYSGDYVLNRNMHQFPPFLQEYNYNSNLDIKMRLILIDEELMTPPYVVAHIFGNKYKKHKLYNNVYHINNIEVISCNEYIDYDLLKRNYAESTYELFTKINNYILGMNNNLLFVHDFSGHNCAHLAEYFDNNSDYYTKIMYDITIRSDRSCRFDLDNKLYKPIIDNFNIFNPVYLNNVDLYELFKDNKYKDQIKLHIGNKYNIFKDKIYPIYRRIYTFMIKNYNYEFKKENNYQDNILSFGSLKRKIDYSIIDYINDDTFKLNSILILETEFQLFNTYKDTLDITFLIHILFSLKDIMTNYIKQLLDIANIKNDDLINTVPYSLIFNDPYTWPKYIEDNILKQFIQTFDLSST
jgi:hypothetical protein